MKSILSYILTVILLCGVTVSCSEKNDEPKLADETVIMFFPFSGLENYIKENIDCMKTAIVKRKGLGNTRLVIFQALSRSNGILYEVTFDNGQCVEHSISDVSGIFYSDNQISNVVQMQSIFDKVKSVAEAKSYAMIIGCHGSSWVPAGNSLTDMSLLLSKQKKSFGSAGEYFQIDNKALVEALNNSNIHLNYLLFDACYMASAEAAYDFRNVCDYYIASQNEILDYGVPYDRIGDALFRHNYRDLVDGFYEFYSNYTISGKSYPYGSLSVINTQHLESLAVITKEMNQHLNPDASLKDVQKMDGINKTVFFDMKDYYHVFCTDQSLLSSFDATLKSVVVFERHTDEYFSAFSSGKYNFPVRTSCGLNISQPTTNSIAANLIHQTDWWNATH